MTDIPIFEIATPVRERYSEVLAGVLVMENLVNPRQHQVLEHRKHVLIHALRENYAGATRASLRQVPALAAYHAYYKAFKKSYHVQHQLESVVIKNRSPRGEGALVEAMFMAELKNLLLTAGHDLDQVQTPIRLDVATGDEGYVRLNKQEQTLKEGDLYMADQLGILSSILYGPDFRTRITPSTQRAVFTVYAPVGIDPLAVEDHLQDIAEFVGVISDKAVTLQSSVY